jgi:hypothetical protein
MRLEIDANAATHRPVVIGFVATAIRLRRDEIARVGERASERERDPSRLDVDARAAGRSPSRHRQSAITRDSTSVRRGTRRSSRLAASITHTGYR